MTSLKSIIDRLKVLKSNIINKTYSLDDANFKNNSSTVIPKGNALFFSDVTLEKPSSLKSSSIVRGKTIMGVSGTHDCDGPHLEENRSATYYSNGTYEIEPTDGYGYDGMEKATITVDVEIEDGKFELSGPSLSADGTQIIATAKVTSSGYLAEDNSITKSWSVTPYEGRNIMPTTDSILIAEADTTAYFIGDYEVVGDSNLVPSNIRKGVTIFGVKGVFEGSNVLTRMDTYIEIDNPNEATYTLIYRGSRGQLVSQTYQETYQEYGEGYTSEGNTFEVLVVTQAATEVGVHSYSHTQITISEFADNCYCVYGTIIEDGDRARIYIGHEDLG